MAIKGNKMVPNQHFHKHYQRFIKTWFNLPGRKMRRKNARITKARKVAPRPVNKIQPIVRCPSIRYNTKVRLGKGFTLGELKAAGIPKGQAQTIGIFVDYRRKNRSVEAMQENVRRLKEYKSRMILFPLKKKVHTKLDSSPEECAKATQLAGKTVMPLAPAKQTIEARTITQKEKNTSVFNILRQERRHAYTWGRRAKKAKELAEEAAVANKK